MTILTQASHQWATRPADERFTDLYALRAKVDYAKQGSRAKVVPTQALEFIPDSDHKGLFIQGQNGTPANVTHWSFGQLAGLAKAPAGYLRDLPAELAADNLNYGMKFRREQDEVGVLLTRNGEGAPELRAATGPNYGRIWNADIARTLTDRFGNGRDGDFRIPGEFGKQVAITNQNTTLYASDRDMFVFLADETNRVEMSDRRGGKEGSLARGFFIWNSEVGSQSFGIAFFLFDYVCMNRIVWGVREFSETRIRHTVSAPLKWLDNVSPMLNAYANASAQPVEQTIKAAQAKKLGDDLDAFLKARKFTSSQISGAKAAHLAEEGRPMETVWDVVTGVTAHAKTIQYQDDRVALERAGGRLLDLVAA